MRAALLALFPSLLSIAYIVGSALKNLISKKAKQNG